MIGHSETDKGPQKENGYTPIANEIMEALSLIRIPGEARQVLDVVLRKTYGFRKKEDCISLSQFCLSTGLNKPHVCQSLIKLKMMNLITEKGNKIATTYCFNKHFKTWKPLPKKVTITEKGNEKPNKPDLSLSCDNIITEKGNDESLPKKVIEITEKGNLPLPKKVHTKETITKETITKDIYTEFWEAYPKRNGTKIGKDQTKLLFEKLSRQDQERVIKAARAYAKNTDFPVDPIRFFKSRDYPKGLWREIEIKEVSQTQKPKISTEEAAREYGRRLEIEMFGDPAHDPQ